MEELSPGTAHAFEGVRTEFVRQEINPATQTASLSDATVYSTELVAEFAVDFKVGIVAMTSPQLPPGTPMALQSTDGTFLNYAGDPTSTAAAAGFGRGPHLIRALVPRLSVRERLPSRDADVDTGATPDGLFRISLQTVDETPTDFARVRTLQTHVMTRNARNVLWQ